MSAKRFKAGDKVKVKDNLVVDNNYDKTLFVSFMEQYKGKTYEIERVNNNSYYLSNCNYWCFSDEMLEPIKTPFKMGDKVKCIDDTIYMLIKKDKNYTIRAISSDKETVKLEEIGDGYWYEVERFELVDEYFEQTTNCLDTVLEKLGLQLEEEFLNNGEFFSFTDIVHHYLNHLIIGQIKYRKIKPMPAPTKEEQKVLDAAKVLGIKWVAKDENAEVYFYTIMPSKNQFCWSVENESSYIDACMDFSFLSWEDEEPYEIK